MGTGLLQVSNSMSYEKQNIVSNNIWAYSMQSKDTAV